MADPRRRRRRADPRACRRRWRFDDGDDTNDNDYPNDRGAAGDCSGGPYRASCAGTNTEQHDHARADYRDGKLCWRRM